MYINVVHDLTCVVISCGCLWFLHYYIKIIVFVMGYFIALVFFLVEYRNIFDKAS